MNRVEQHHGADYIVVLTDKNEGQPMLHSMFRHAPPVSDKTARNADELKERPCLTTLAVGLGILHAGAPLADLKCGKRNGPTKLTLLSAIVSSMRRFGEKLRVRSVSGATNARGILGDLEQFGRQRSRFRGDFR